MNPWCPRCGKDLHRIGCTSSFIKHWWCAACRVVWCGDSDTLFPCDSPMQHTGIAMHALAFQIYDKSGFLVEPMFSRMV